MTSHELILAFLGGVPFIVICLLLAYFSFAVVKVSHTSMEPTLSHRDRVVVFRYWPARWLRKGWIVIFWPEQFGPFRAEQDTPYIKRVVGLPGDTVVLPENEHQSGQTVWPIPPRHFFVLADNLSTTSDSRLWGPVSFNGLQGVVILKLP